jgi:hypothetical protein
MEIFDFKLISGGRGGIKIDAREFFGEGNIQIMDKVQRERKIQLPMELIDKIQGIKYYFLNITGHWIDRYNEYYDKERFTIVAPQGEPVKSYELARALWQKTEITGAKIIDSKIIIKGSIEVVDGKVMGLSTPKISIEDDFSFFNELYDFLSDICNDIELALSNPMVRLEQTKQIILEEKIKELTEDDVEGLTETEIIEQYANVLEKHGLFVMRPDAPDAIGTGNPTEVHKSNGTIGAQGEDGIEIKSEEDIPETTDQEVDLSGMNEDDYPDAEADKKGVSDLEKFEHSENMGLQSESEENGGSEW